MQTLLLQLLRLVPNSEHMHPILFVYVGNSYLPGFLLTRSLSDLLGMRVFLLKSVKVLLLVMMRQLEGEADMFVCKFDEIAVNVFIIVVILS